MQNVLWSALLPGRHSTEQHSVYLFHCRHSHGTPFWQYCVNSTRERQRARAYYTIWLRLMVDSDYVENAHFMQRTMELICRQRQKHFEACLPNCMKWDGNFIRTAKL